MHFVIIMSGLAADPNNIKNKPKKKIRKKKLSKRPNKVWSKEIKTKKIKQKWHLYRHAPASRSRLESSDSFLVLSVAPGASPSTPPVGLPALCKCCPICQLTQICISAAQASGRMTYGCSAFPGPSPYVEQTWPPCHRLISRSKNFLVEISC